MNQIEQNHKDALLTNKSAEFLGLLNAGCIIQWVLFVFGLCCSWENGCASIFGGVGQVLNLVQAILALNSRLEQSGKVCAGAFLVGLPQPNLAGYYEIKTARFILITSIVQVAES